MTKRAKRCLFGSVSVAVVVGMIAGVAWMMATIVQLTHIALVHYVATP